MTINLEEIKPFSRALQKFCFVSLNNNCSVVEYHTRSKHDVNKIFWYEVKYCFLTLKLHNQANTSMNLRLMFSCHSKPYYLWNIVVIVHQSTIMGSGGRYQRISKIEQIIWAQVLRPSHVLGYIQLWCLVYLHVRMTLKLKMVVVRTKQSVL